MSHGVLFQRSQNTKDGAEAFLVVQDSSSHERLSTTILLLRKDHVGMH